jgi:butyryl-CoA dehydrogenase
LAGNDLAIQVHGGYGYTREYDVEQHYRDNRLNPIHEGTHGIQSLDLLGRKVLGAGLEPLHRAMSRTIAAGCAAGAEATELAEQLTGAAARLLAVTGRLLDNPDAQTRLANSSIYLEAAGHVALAWIWLEQYLACGRRDEPLHRGKAAGGSVLLPLRTTPYRAAAGSARADGPDHCRDGPELVLTRSRRVSPAR